MWAVSVDLALVVGHNRLRQGAYSPALDQYEWEWCGGLAALIAGAVQRLSGPSVSVFEREVGVLYSEEMRRLVQTLDLARPRLIVSLHFNSIGDGSRSGCAALYCPGSTRGKEAAEALCTAVAGVLGNRRIGAIPQSRSWSTIGTRADGSAYPAGRKLAVLTSTRAPAVLLEPFFGDHAEDATIADHARNSGTLPKAIAEACSDLLKRWA